MVPWDRVLPSLHHQKMSTPAHIYSGEGFVLELTATIGPSGLRALSRN